MRKRLLSNPFTGAMLAVGSGQIKKDVTNERFQGPRLNLVYILRFAKYSEVGPESALTWGNNKLRAPDPGGLPNYPC